MMPRGAGGFMLPDLASFDFATFIKCRPDTSLLPRAALSGGPVQGPAILESYDTTIIIPPGCVAAAIGSGCVAIDMGEPDA
jgi:N-methylhydantoinase A/oxoprolinase/acetone carboxylase beta subunit